MPPRRPPFLLKLSHGMWKKKIREYLAHRLHSHSDDTLSK